MRRILAVVLLSVAAFPQTAVTRISPDEAAKHLLIAPPPQYPKWVDGMKWRDETKLVEETPRSVLLEIGIDEFGVTSLRRLIRGDPVLVRFAIEAVKKWRYQPFQIAGQPIPVKTLVIVTIGKPGSDAAQVHSELGFQNDFWMALESAEDALAKRDSSRSEEQLNKARDLLAPYSTDKRHAQERWRWTTTMGRLRMSQRRYQEAELQFRNALAIRENQSEDKNSPEIAASLADLATLFAEEQRNDLARENAARSLAIFQNNFKSTASGDTSARRTYGRAVSQESLLLLKLAKERKDFADANKQCHTILDFQSFLNAPDRDSVVAACGSTATSETKP